MQARANTDQVGGQHYRRIEGEQHWDRVWRLYGNGYFVGCITKYVERYKQKNGLEDLRKAAHFLQKLIELEEATAPVGTGRIGETMSWMPPIDEGHPLPAGYVDQDR